MEAKKLKDPTTKYYFNKITGEELLDTLTKAVEDAVEMVLWLKDLENDVQIYYPIKLDKNAGKLFLEYRPSLLHPMKSKFIDRQVFAKMNMEKYYIFAHGKLHFEENTYFLDLSSVFYKSQQRENLRLESAADLNIKMQIQIGEDSFEINDTSASGASFFIPQEKLPNFAPGKTYSKIVLTLEQESFKIPRLEVLKEIEVKNKTSSNLKCVAVKFTDIFSTEETKLVVKLTSLIKKIAILRTPKK